MSAFFRVSYCVFSIPDTFCCRFINGQKSVVVKEMMKTYSVNIEVPHPNTESNLIMISGVPAKVEAAKVGLHKKVTELEAEKGKMEKEVSERSKKRVAGCSPEELPPAKRLSKASDSVACSSLSLSGGPPGSARKCRVMFNGIIRDEDSALVEELGGSLTKDIAECSVLVSDKMKRTQKLLYMAARGVPIVSKKWLVESRAAMRFLEPWGFILRDQAVEEKWGCRLEDTLKKAGLRRILTGASDPGLEMFEKMKG